MKRQKTSTRIASDLVAHYKRHREAITGVDFQALIRFGLIQHALDPSFYPSIPEVGTVNYYKQPFEVSQFEFNCAVRFHKLLTKALKSTNPQHVHHWLLSAEETQIPQWTRGLNEAKNQIVETVKTEPKTKRKPSQRKGESVANTKQENRQLSLNGVTHNSFLTWYAINYLNTEVLTSDNKKRNGDLYERRTELLEQMKQTANENPEEIKHLHEQAYNAYKLNPENPNHAQALKQPNKNRAWYVNVLPTYKDTREQRESNFLALYILKPELLEQAHQAQHKEQ